MKLNKLKGTDLEITDAMRAAVDRVMEDLTKYAEHFGEAISADVEVGKTTQHHHKGPFFRAEINIAIPRKLLRAEATDEDLYVAIDRMGEEISRELRKEKELLTEKQGRGIREVTESEEALRERTRRGIMGQSEEELEEEFRKGPEQKE